MHFAERRYKAIQRLMELNIPLEGNFHVGTPESHIKEPPEGVQLELDLGLSDIDTAMAEALLNGLHYDSDHSLS